MEKLRSHLDAERGRTSRLAEALGLTYGAIKKWREVPAERVVEVEKATGIPRHELRPDLHLLPAQDATLRNMDLMEKFRTYLKKNRGTQTSLARHLGLTDATVSKWKRIPFEHIISVSDFTGLSLQELLPPSKQVEVSQRNIKGLQSA